MKRSGLVGVFTPRRVGEPLSSILVLPRREGSVEVLGRK